MTLMRRGNAGWAIRSGLVSGVLGVAGCFNVDDPPAALTDGGSGSTASSTAGMTTAADSGTPSTDPDASSDTTSNGPAGTSGSTASTTVALDDGMETGGSSSSGGAETGQTGETGVSGTSTGEATTGPVSCNPLLADCGADEYCEASDCGTTGVCTDRPPMTDVAYDRACGCNGISYWNVQHANWLGVPAEAAPNGCAELNCFEDDDCPAGTECIIDYGLSACSGAGDVEGQCYGIPPNASCEGAPAGPVGFGSCDSGPFSCTAAALNLCEALIEGEFFVVCL